LQNAEDHEILFITPPLLENLGYPTNEDKEKYDSSLLGTRFARLFLSFQPYFSPFSVDLD
jgi:hypothetical protein